MKSSVLRAAVLSASLGACTSSPPLSLPPTACSVLASIGNTSSCHMPNRQQFDIRGVWQYMNCKYTRTSPNFSSQLGLACAGTLSLCGDAETADITWDDRGPNGMSMASPQDVELSSFEKDGQQNAWVFGQVISGDSQSSCSARVDVTLGCVLSALTTAKCFKLSAILSNGCGVPPGWVMSSFDFQRIGDCN